MTSTADRRTGTDRLMAVNAVEVIGSFESGCVYVVASSCIQIAEIFRAITIERMAVPAGDAVGLIRGTVTPAAAGVGRPIAGRVVMAFNTGGITDVQLMVKCYRDVAEAVQEDLTRSFVTIHAGRSQGRQKQSEKQEKAAQRKRCLFSFHNGPPFIFPQAGCGPFPPVACRDNIDR